MILVCNEADIEKYRDKGLGQRPCDSQTLQKPRYDTALNFHEIFLYT